MNHQEQERQRNILRDKFKALCLEYAPLALTPEALARFDEGDTLVVSIASLANHVLGYDPHYMIELAAKCTEEVNYHDLAASIRG